MISTYKKNDHSRKILSIALLAGLGVVLHRLEILLPLPSPWVKLGLANVMSLIALVFLGFREAITVTVLRVFLGSILGGTFLSPTFFLSLAGGLSGVFAMGLVYRNGAGPFSLVGVSVVAAFTHTTVIFLCVYSFFISQGAFLNFLPIFLLLALVTGILTGTMAETLKLRLAEENISFK
jgi:heptaprenyl diphosphate synthase